MRIASIDILRALTMLFMIWVNDFFTLVNAPKWLIHATAKEDYLGFSDIIFPLFLFIVGLSIPFAIRKRRNQGDSKNSIAKHILIRSMSLLIIGVYMVNYETAHHDSILVGRFYWCILMALGVGLIWMDWARSPLPKNWHWPLQGLGFIILLFLAVIYKGGPDGESWMTTQWWGILGLIGWAYLANALIYLYSKGNLLISISVFLLFNLLSVLNQLDALSPLPKYLDVLSTIYQGTIPGFTAAGIMATQFYLRISKYNTKWFFSSLILLGILNLVLGLVTRPAWGISKIQGTPSWLAVCTGIGFLVFAIFYVVADIRKQKNWARIIAPAGTATLTCYMIPYLVYPLREITDIRFPELINSGAIGLIGSSIFALLVVIFTGWLERKGYKLKL
jgi:predicted acyltransferase